MANEETAERESLMRRPVGNWSANRASNAMPLSSTNSRALHFQPPIFGQPAMPLNQPHGNALQQWRMNFNQQPQRFPQTIPGALPNASLAYSAQIRPPSGPFVDSAVADAAAAVAAARSRMSQNQPQAQRTDPTFYRAGNPNVTASSNAAAVLARVYPQQGIPNPQANPQQTSMHNASLFDDPWKAIAAHPQLHLPSTFIHPPVRPPTTILGPQMPTPFPGQVPPLMHPSFAGSPRPPARPTLITDQPRLATLMAEYSNRLASTYPMMPTRPPLPVPFQPVHPAYPIRSTLPAPLAPSAYPGPHPVIPIPVSPPIPTVPINLQAKPQLWPDPRIPPELIRSNSAPPIPPPFFNPLLQFGHTPLSGFTELSAPVPDSMFAPEQCAPDEDHTSETEKVKSKEESEACAPDKREEEQRAESQDSHRVRPSASHGDAEGEGLADRRYQSAPRSERAWPTAAKSIRSRRPDEVSDEDPPTNRKFVLSEATVGAVSEELAEHLIVDPEPFVDPELFEHILIKRNVVEQSSDQKCPKQGVSDKESIEGKLSESRNVVISELNRHAALVEDTVETVSEDRSTVASNKHRKIAAQKSARRRAVLRPTLSNSASITSTRAFGHSSPALSSAPDSNSNDSKTDAVHFEDPADPKKSALKPGQSPSRPPFCIPSFFPPFPRATFSVVMSLQYAKFVIVLGLVLPVSELLSPYIRPYSYQAFYLYLYLGSILFMVYINITAAWRRRVRLSIERRKASGDAGPAAGGSICHTASRLSRLPRLRFKRDRSESEDVRYGSVYLRIGVNAFGIGSMVYCGLEVAREIEQWILASSPHPLIGHVDRPVRLLLPACRAALTILQMHFILFNEKASEIRRQRTPARIGLAHMIATNVCEWLGVVVQETRHEILQLSAMGVTTTSTSRLLAKEDMSNSTISDDHNATPEGIVGPLLHTVAPLLSPCTIEYSLICAVLLFEMWKEVGQAEEDGSSTAQESQSISSAGGTNAIVDSPFVGALATVGATAALAGDGFQGAVTRTRGAHQLSADLTHSQRGAFGGVLLLVLTLLGVALLNAQRSLSIGEITDPSKAALVQLPYDAVLEAILSSAVLLGIIVVAITTRKLAFDNVPAYPLPLDLFLLVAAQTSAYVYSLFVIIGCYVLLRNSEEPVAVHYHAAVIMGVEALSTLRAYAQTHVIVRSWHRRPVDARQANEKPGRQAVTLLMFANLCLWAASTFGSARAQRLPHHMRLFGVLPWTAIAHACLPLTIFLHLHSSICLFELWKNCYKFRPD